MKELNDDWLSWPPEQLDNFFAESLSHEEDPSYQLQLPIYPESTHVGTTNTVL